MLKKYTADDFVNTSEAYSDKIFIGSNNIAIPYINVGLMPDNPITKKQSVIEFSYYVLTGLKSMKFQAKRGKLDLDFNFTITETVIKEYVMVGGYKNDNEAELEIECTGLLFFLPPYSKSSEFPNLFVPVDTPNFKCNMNTDQVESFFSYEKLPKEIKEVLGPDIYSLKWY